MGFQVHHLIHKGRQAIGTDPQGRSQVEDGASSQVDRKNLAKKFLVKSS